MCSLIPHGKRLVQFQKWCNLSVTVNLFQNRSAFSNSFSSVASSADVRSRDGRKGNNFTVSYLVDSLGLTTKLAESISSKVSFENKGNPDSVLNLLRSHGFTVSQISSIITDYPLLLIADADNSLGPKLKLLQSRGASSSELTEIVSKVPKILGMKGDKSISRYYDIVKEIVEADKSSKFEKLCHSLPEGSKQENKIRNVLVLRELGVPQRLLFSLLISNHHVCCGKEKFEESLEKVVGMGFDPTTPKFVEALCIVYGLSDKRLEENFNVYKRFGLTNPLCLRASEQQILNSMETFIGLGFSRDEFVMMVKRFPQCIGYSAEMVKKKTEFVVKKMNWPLKVITLFPQVLGYSMEKRIVPRCNVIKALMSKGSLGSELPPMPSVLACTDQTFLSRLVQLQKWRHLRVSVNLLEKPSPFPNSFSYATATDASLRAGRKRLNFSVSYLVASLGLTKEVAESISRKVCLVDKGNPDSVLSLLRSYAFTDSQISTIVTDYPQLLIADAEKSLAPKLQFLLSRGASSSELAVIVSTVPKILGKKGDKTISIYYDFIKEIIEADKKSSKYEKLCHSFPQGSNLENKIRNVSVLRELGVPQRVLFSLLISDHQPVCGKENFEESLKKVVEMGFDPTTSKFVEALNVVYRLSDETIEEKVNVCKGLGFSVGDVWEMFKKWPCFLNNSEKKISQTFETLKKCGLPEDVVLSLLKKFPQCINASEQKILNTIDTFLGLGFSRDEFAMIAKRFPPCLILSAATVKKKTEFVVKKMNWPLKAVVSTPAVLGYSLEKRTIPRCNVIKALMSKGLPGSELPPMSSVLIWIGMMQ
ncbi:unnamed protein product [Arabidopsis halleri]